MAAVIGETARKVWAYLNKNGEVVTTRLMREVGAPRDMTQRAVGWLAREDKVAIETVDGAERIRLK